MMRYLECDSDSGQCRISTAPIPELGSDDVLLKVTAFGINRADLLQKEGKYPPPKGASDILGMEVSGIVQQTGASVAKNVIGRQVCAMITGGGYAEFVAVNVAHLIPVSGQMDPVHSGGLPEVFLTAYQALFDIGSLKPKQRVLVHAGASGVGTAAIQLAHFMGCEVAVTTSTDVKNAACEQLGARICINYKTNKFDDVLKSKGFAPNVIIDVVGEGNLQRNINVAAMDCVIIQLAMLGGRYAQQLDIAKLLAKRIQLQGSTLRNRSDHYKTRLVNGLLEQFGDAFINNDIHPVVDTIYCANDIALAHQKMAQNNNIGKLIAHW